MGMVSKRIYIILLLAIVLFGAGLRFYHLGEQSLWNDEAYSYNSGLDLLDSNWHDAPTSGETSLSIVNSGLIAVSVYLFGDSESSARFPSVIFGIATIVMVYLFANSVTKNRMVALLSSAIVAFLPIEIAWSRQARMYQELQFFYLLSLYLLVLYVEKRNAWYFIGLILSVVLATLTHRLGLLLIFVCLIYVVLNVKDWKFMLSKGVIISLIFALCAMIGLQLLWHIPFSIAGEIGYCNWSPYYASYFRVTFPLLSLFAVVGSLMLLRKNNVAYLMLIIPIFVPMMALCYCLERGVGYRFVYMLLPFIFILSSYAIVEMCIISKRFHLFLRMREVFPVLLFVVVMLVVSTSSGLVFVPRSEYYGFDPSIQQPKFEEAYHYVNGNIVEGDIVIDSWPSVGMHYLHSLPDYCIMSYGLTRERDKIVYIVDYVDFANIVRYKSGWLVVDTVGMELLDNDVRFGNGEFSRFVSENMSADCVVYGKKGDITVYRWKAEA
jgi:4-amino-4-deoxy-L-arabinose transferase-like glycosyltransferase